MCPRVSLHLTIKGAAILTGPRGGPTATAEDAEGKPPGSTCHGMDIGLHVQMRTAAGVEQPGMPT